MCSSLPLLLAQDAEKGSIAPTLPQARRNALLPELRSRLAKNPQRTSLVKEPVLAGSWRAGENQLRFRLLLSCGLVTCLFEHPVDVLLFIEILG